MNNFRDSLYNKSDILVVLVIIFVAGLLIFSRASVLLTTSEVVKPQKDNDEILELKESVREGKSAVTTDTAVAPAVSKPAVAVTPTATSSTPAAKPKVVTKTFTIVETDASETIAENLKSAGLIKSAEEFLTYINSEGLEKELKTGIYKIKTGLSNKDVADIIT
ncbi:MAG: endolytic transglycosylase MltG [Clostridiales Family XIII bacterium]|jgi:cell division protein YceG involved in septum cleavage|nr:endolytic transglycosylase MltG [Clostridiales Family XIII bacterium]